MRVRMALLKSLVILSMVLLVFGCKKRVFPPEKVVITGYGAPNPTKPQEEKKVEEPKATEKTESWADMDITAIGNGAPPADAVNQSQARMMAKRAAKMDALRNLAETVKGVQIDSTTKVEDFITKSDEIRSKIDMFIQGSQTLEEKELADGTWEVKVGLNLKPLEEIIKPEKPAQPATTTASTSSAPSPGPTLTPQQAKLMAKRAAEMDARRNLLEYVKGVQIDSSTYVRDFMTQSDSIRSQIDGMVKGAQVIATRWNDDGTCEVDIQFDLANVKKLIK